MNEEAQKIIESFLKCNELFSRNKFKYYFSCACANAERFLAKTQGKKWKFDKPIGASYMADINGEPFPPSDLP